MNKKINFVAILLVSFIFTITLIITYDNNQAIFPFSQQDDSYHNSDSTIKKEEKEVKQEELQVTTWSPLIIIEIQSILMM